MKALLSSFAVAAVLVAFTAPAAGAERTRTLHTFICPGSNTTLRVIFNSSDNTALVTRIRQPSIRLRRVQGEGENFRYVRPGETLTSSPAIWSGCAGGWATPYGTAPLAGERA